jgi:hypothetical protein
MSSPENRIREQAKSSLYEFGAARYVAPARSGVPSQLFPLGVRRCTIARRGVPAPEAPRLRFIQATRRSRIVG